MAEHQATTHTRPLSGAEARIFLSRHLHGDGIEVGPGHQPFPLPPGARARYIDRWLPHENRARFPELGDTSFPTPHLAAHFDRDRLAPIPDLSCDFVICSHVIEHLAEPIGFLTDVHRVLRRGGVALLVVPDRRRTFDSARAPTTLSHLIAEHAGGITDVDDEHLIDFLANAGDGAAYLGVPADPDERARWFAWHRERSIHVHCWSEHEFAAVIAYTIDALGLAWELVEAMATAAEGPTGAEFGYVLERSSSGTAPADRAARLVAMLESWRQSGRAVFGRPPVATPSRATLVVDAPADGATVDQPFVVGGWAVDAGSRAGTGIDVVEAWAISSDGAEHFLGLPPPIGDRPDVAAAVGARAAKSGYTLTAAGLPPGQYTLVVGARSADRNACVAVQRRQITVLASLTR